MDHLVLLVLTNHILSLSVIDSDRFIISSADEHSGITRELDTSDPISEFETINELTSNEIV